MRIVQPKRFLSYTIQTFDGKAKVTLNCYPQQKWEFVRFTDNQGITLLRKETWLTIPTDDFDKNWKIIE